MLNKIPLPTLNTLSISLLSLSLPITSLASSCGFEGFSQQSTISLNDIAGQKSQYCLGPGQEVILAASVTDFLNSSLAGAELKVACTIDGTVNWSKVNNVNYVQASNTGMLSSGSYNWQIEANAVIKGLVTATFQALNNQENRVSLSSVQQDTGNYTALNGSGDIALLQFQNMSQNQVAIHCQDASPPANHLWESLGMGLFTVIASVIPVMLAARTAVSAADAAAESAEGADDFASQSTATGVTGLGSASGQAQSGSALLARRALRTSLNEALSISTDSEATVDSTNDVVTSTTSATTDEADTPMTVRTLRHRLMMNGGPGSRYAAGIREKIFEKYGELPEATPDTATTTYLTPHLETPGQTSFVGMHDVSLSFVEDTGFLSDEEMNQLSAQLELFYQQQADEGVTELASRAPEAFIRSDAYATENNIGLNRFTDGVPNTVGVSETRLGMRGFFKAYFEFLQKNYNFPTS